MSGQLSFDFSDSSAQRHRRAVKAIEAFEQPNLFATWAPNIDVHLHSPSEAIAQISGQDLERAHNWLAGIVGSVRSIKARRVAFPADKLDRLLHLRPPAQVTLDAAATAVGRALWAHKLGLKPLVVRRERQRLLADSPRWPTGFRVKDAPWTAIATIVHLGMGLNVDDNARTLLRRKLEDAGTKVAAAGLAGSAVVIETSRPEIVENMGLPGLAFAGERNCGTYKVPLLSSEGLLRQQVIDVPPELERAIKRATSPTKPLGKKDLGPDFPWTLYDFQANDAGRAVRILETTGGVLLAGDMGSGKGAAVDSVVLTPLGKKLAGSVRTGEFLVGADGKPTRVLGVYPQGRQALYRFTFTDGSTAIVDDSHLWAVHSAVMKKRGRPNKVLSTKKLREQPLKDGAGNLRWYIPICDPIQFEGVATLPVDPYVLGALLGDGCITEDMSYAAADEFLVDEMNRLLPEGCDLKLTPLNDTQRRVRATEQGCSPDEVGDYSYTLRGGERIKAPLRMLGVLGERAWEKSVPELYLYAPEADRRALLQGLLDTDGDLKNEKQLSSIEFCSTSEQLVDDVRWIVQSLGGTARKTGPRRTRYTYKGKTKLGRPSWRLSIQLPPGAHPFRLPRKAELYADRVNYHPTRGIVSIERVEDGESVCFQVDAHDSLYLLDEAVVQHNTTISLALVQHLDIWPLLVVSPLSAFSTWERQLGQMGRRAYLATETVKKSWEAIEHGDFEAVVMSFDRLPAFTELVERMDFRGIVADEIQRIRTPGSKRSRALRQLASTVPLRIGLSGTPLTNTVNDLLPLGAFLAPGEWRPRANEKDLEDMYPGDPTESIAEHLGSLMVRRRMDDTGATLPKRNDHRIYIELTPEQRKALADLEAEAEAAKEQGEFDDPQGRFHAFAKLQKQRQIINSPAQAGIGGQNPKVTAALKLAKDFLDQGRKGVLFCADRTTFAELGRRLDQMGIGWVGIWGSTPPADRIKHEKMFHANAIAPNGHPTSVVVCTIQAGSESWSASPTATWLISTAYVYAPSTLAQMECRVYRLNSDVNGPDIEICYIHAQAPGGSLDDRMVEILEVKKELFAQVVDRQGYQDVTKVHYSMGDLVYLLTGTRDAKLDKQEADKKAVTAREQAKKDHAKRTLYGHKKRNADLKLDDGAMATTLEEYQGLDELLDAVDHDDAFDATDEEALLAGVDDAGFDIEDDED